MNKIFNRSNITTALLALLVLVLMVSPRAKALMIQGLMNVGFFRPPTSVEKPVTGPAIAPVQLSLRSADGTHLNIAEQKGKVIIINFWATWCPPCIAEMPSIDALSTQFKRNKNLLIIPVDVDGDFKRSVAFMKKNDLSLPVYAVEGGIPDGLVGNTIPATLIIDKEGRVAARHEGAANYANPDFAKFVKELLAR